MFIDILLTTPVYSVQLITNSQECKSAVPDDTETLVVYTKFQTNNLREKLLIKCKVQNKKKEKNN